MHIHSLRVIDADLRTDSFLLDDNLSIMFTDFGESSLMPVDWDMDEANGDGESTQTDIGTFRAVNSAILTSKLCKCDLMQDWKEPVDPFTWPRRGGLPPTHKLWLVTSLRPAVREVHSNVLKNL